MHRFLLAKNVTVLPETRSPQRYATENSKRNVSLRARCSRQHIVSGN
jgi:hypothetical protein